MAAQRNLFRKTSTVKVNLVTHNYKFEKCIAGPDTKQTRTHEYTNTCAAQLHNSQERNKNTLW